MAVQTKSVILNDTYQLAGTATASQFAIQVTGGVAQVVFDGTTAPVADADCFEMSGFNSFAIPGNSSIWVKGTGKCTIVFG